MTKEEAERFVHLLLGAVTLQPGDTITVSPLWSGCPTCCVMVWREATHEARLIFTAAGAQQYAQEHATTTTASPLHGYYPACH